MPTEIDNSESEFLHKDLGLLGEYTRNAFGWYVKWYTFFATINILSGAALLAKLSTGTPTPLLFVWSFAGPFAIANILAIVFSFTATRTFTESNTREEKIRATIFASTPHRTLLLQAALPLKFYTQASLLFRITFFTILAGWLLTLVFACKQLPFDFTWLPKADG